MAEQVLDILKRYSLAKQIRRRRRPKRMTRQVVGELGLLKPPLEHGVDLDAEHTLVRDLASTVDRPE